MLYIKETILNIPFLFSSVENGCETGQKIKETETSEVLNRKSDFECRNQVKAFSCYELKL